MATLWRFLRSRHAQQIAQLIFTFIAGEFEKKHKNDL